MPPLVIGAYAIHRAVCNSTVTFCARLQTSDVVLDYSIGDKRSRNYTIVKIFSTFGYLHITDYLIEKSTVSTSDNSIQLRGCIE